MSTSASAICANGSENLFLGSTFKRQPELALIVLVTRINCLAKSCYFFTWPRGVRHFLSQSRSHSDASQETYIFRLPMSIFLMQGQFTKLNIAGRSEDRRVGIPRCKKPFNLHPLRLRSRSSVETMSVKRPSRPRLS